MLAESSDTSTSKLNEDWSLNQEHNTAAVLNLALHPGLGKMNIVHGPCICVSGRDSLQCNDFIYKPLRVLKLGFDKRADLAAAMTYSKSLCFCLH